MIVIISEVQMGKVILSKKIQKTKYTIYKKPQQERNSEFDALLKDYCKKKIF